MTDEQLKEIYIAKTGYEACTNLDIAAMRYALHKESIEFAEWINKEAYQEYDGYDRWIKQKKHFADQ